MNRRQHYKEREDIEMTREDFFEALWQMVKDTDVDYQELMDDDGEGSVYIKFTNIETEEMA